MAQTFYRYRALSADGRIVSGMMSALNPQALAATLAAQSLELISAKPVQKPLAKAVTKTLSRRELIDLFYYLEVLLKAGVPAIEALRDLASSAQSGPLRLVAMGMAESIENGATFSQALAAQPAIARGVLPRLIESGETSGQLDAVLGEIVLSLKWLDEVVAAAKKAMLYPAFAFTVISGVSVFLMTYLVPQLVPFIINMGGELPLHTRALIWTSELIIHWWWLLLPAPILLAFLLMALARAHRGFRKKLHGLILRAPVFGPVIGKIVLSQVINTLAMMYRSGVPLLEALDRCVHVSRNLVIADGLRLAHERVAAGVPLSQAFAVAGVFPPLLLRMLRVGESTGALDEALMNARYFYQREINETVGKLQSLIEPVLVVVLGAILGWIMLAVLGPIYDIISKIKL
ncbi:MAG: type II secretion system F family protein [Rhodocyclaceae bacterium]